MVGGGVSCGSTEPCLNISTENIQIHKEKIENSTPILFTNNSHTHRMNSKMYGREITVEVAVDLSWTVILQFNTRGCCEAFFSRRGQQR